MANSHGQSSSQHSVSCFVSATAQTHLSIIREVCKKIGIFAYDAYDFNIGDPVNEDIKSKIKKSDFVIAILSTGQNSIIYEIGIAQGLDKPLLIIINPELEIPDFLKHYPVVRTDLKDSTMLEIAFAAFVRELSPDRISITKIPSKQTKSISKEYAGEVTKKIDLLRKSNDPIEIERQALEIVHSIFLRLGFDVAKRPDKSDIGADLAVWSSQLQFSIGTLLLVELKCGQLSKEVILTAERQLLNYLDKAEAQAGILLYLDVRNRRFSGSTLLDPLILRFDLEDFAQAILDKGFETTLLMERNRMIHGGRK